MSASVFHIRAVCKLQVWFKIELLLIVDSLIGLRGLQRKIRRKMEKYEIHYINTNLPIRQYTLDSELQSENGKLETINDISEHKR